MNFQGKREEKTQVENVPILVSDYMASKLITFTPDQTIYDVMKVLLKNRISGAPVVNDRNELVGVISEGDCLKLITEGRYHNLPVAEATVEKYMATDVHTIGPNTTVFDAAKKFLTTRVRRFPVLDHNQLIGQISQKDVMKAVLELQSATW